MVPFRFSFLSLSCSNMSGEKKGKAPFYFTYLPCYLPSTPGATPFTPPDGFSDANMGPAEGNQAGLVTRAIGPESPVAASSTDSGELSPRSPQPSSSTTKSDSKPGRKVYDTWSQEEKQLLVHLWIGHYEKLQRKRDTRKAWQKISDALHARLGSSKGTEKCTKKMKYLIERYREAKDASSKRTDGFSRKSEFYDEIDSVLEADPSLYTVQLPKDVVTFRHVVETAKGPAPITAEADRHLSLSETSQHLLKGAAPEPMVLTSNRAAPVLEARGSVSAVEQGEEGGQAPKQDARTERKKSGKKRKAEEEEDEEKRMLKETFEKFQEQGDRMVRCMESFSETQNQQVQMMNHFLGTMMQFMQSHQHTD